MKCMNCGTELTDSAYCPKCGCGVSVQKQAIVLSGLYYNQGLEKAQVRDLSGAIDQLKRSLKFNKLNVPARNLLGLVYFETGEVVSALSEWVISKNIQPEDNIATDYIRILQQDANRLDVINQTIKKYNIALGNCLEGNEDVALIQLKKILAQNPKLIKGYHLLALLYLHKGEYEKARRLLKRAIRIDKSNTTTLRFLREVEEQTGTVTTLEPHFSLWGGKKGAEEASPEEQPAAAATGGFYHLAAGGRGFPFLNILFGAVIGAAAIWFLFIPAYTRSINRVANEKITRYSSDMAVYSSQIQTMNDQIRASQNTVNTARERIDAANAKAQSYDNLINAQNASNNGSFEAAATALADIDPSQLSVEAKAVYDGLSLQLENYLLSAYKKVGLDAFSAGDYEKAIVKLSAAHAIDPTDYDILNYLAHSYRLLGDTKHADEYFMLIVTTFPGTQKADNAEQYLSDDARASMSEASDGTAALAETSALRDTGAAASEGNTETGAAENGTEAEGGGQDNGGEADGGENGGEDNYGGENGGEETYDEENYDEEDYDEEYYDEEYYDEEY